MNNNVLRLVQLKLPLSASTVTYREATCSWPYLKCPRSQVTSTSVVGCQAETDSARKTRPSAIWRRKTSHTAFVGTIRTRQAYSCSFWVAKDKCIDNRALISRALISRKKVARSTSPIESWCWANQRSRCSGGSNTSDMS